MYSVGNDLGSEPLVGQHFAQNARIAVLQWTHGIEGVSGMPGPGGHARLRGLQVGIRVSDAYAHAAPRCFRDHCSRPLNLRRDGDHADMSARRLPESVKRFEGRWKDIARGVYAPPLVADEWPFQVDAQGT